MVTKKFATEALIGFEGCKAEGEHILITFRRGFSDLQMVKFAAFVAEHAVPRSVQANGISASFLASEKTPLTTVRIEVGPKAERAARIVNRGHKHCIKPTGKGRLRQTFIQRMDAK